MRPSRHSTTPIPALRSQAPRSPCGHRQAFHTCRWRGTAERRRASARTSTSAGVMSVLDEHFARAWAGWHWATWRNTWTEGQAGEARARLEGARALAWQLWAVAIGAVYPVFGLTAVLDAAEARLPPGLDATAAGPDPADIRRAGIATANLLTHVTAQAQSRLAFAAPRAWRPGPGGGWPPPGRTEPH
ncbi:MAG: hypothetical protein ABJB47_00005 [Actinomycetota bacterium]